MLGAAESGSRWLVPRSSTMVDARILERSHEPPGAARHLALVSAVLNA